MKLINFVSVSAVTSLNAVFTASDMNMGNNEVHVNYGYQGLSWQLWASMRK